MDITPTETSRRVTYQWQPDRLQNKHNSCHLHILFEQQNTSSEISGPLQPEASHACCHISTGSRARAIGMSSFYGPTILHKFLA
jgi:hypothetical protein